MDPLTIVASGLLDSAKSSLGQGLPRVFAAILLLIIGLVAARVIGALVRRSLQALGLDRASESWGIPRVLARAGLPESLSQVAGVAIRVALTVTVIFAALSLLGLQFLSASLNAAVLFVPKLLVALVLLLAGVVLGALLRERVERAAAQMDLPVPIGVVAQVAVVAMFALTAAAQIGVSVQLLMVLLMIILSGSVATLVLAFGLGGREIARALSAARYVRTAHPPGQQIRVGGVTGTVERVETTATLLTTPDGARLRVPNHLLIESIVVIEASPDTTDS